MDSEKLFINAEYIKSIERAIAHGVELQKSKLCHQVEKPSLPDTNEVHRSLNKSRNHSRKVKELMLNNAITHAQKPSLTTKSKIHSGSSYFTKGPGRLSNKRSQTCPIRIAELAMPSKRYCIATWRDRYNVLPTNNLEKLKELVKKQKLVATIPEAIQCFKGQKYDGSKVTDERNQSRNRGARKMKKLSNPDDFKIMCAIFAHSVAARLIKPKNVFLSEELENLSIVVADEIKNLLQYRRRSANCDYFNTKLLKEMTAKITLWISNIMDIAHYNMLEAELRVQKKNENIMGKEGNLVTLIDQYTDWQREERPTDLEEEEGPVFDAIDTILNNVLDICLPKKSTNSSVCDNNLMDGKVMTTLLQIVNQDDEAVDKDHDSEFDGKTNLSSYISYENGVQYPMVALLKQANIYNDSVRDSGRGSEVVTVETQDGNNKDLHSEDLNINDAAIIGETQDKKDTDSDSQDHDGDLSNDDSQDSRYVSTSDLDITTAHDKSLVDAIDDEEIINLNIDETLEEPLDDRKKVKFSQVKTGGTDGTARIGGTGPNLGTAEYDGRGRNGDTRINNSSDTRINATKRLKSNESLLKWPQYSLSSTFIRSDIVFQNPNNNILSLVDEKWPDEYSNHVLRPSKSISKSITSLGDIKEVDDEIEQKDQHINHNRHHIFNKKGKYHQGKRGKGTGNRLKLLGMDYENNILDETSTSGSSREYGQNIKNERSNTKRLQQRDDYTEMSITPSKLLDDIRSSIAAEATQEGKEPEINKEKCSVFEAENIKAAGKGDHIDINKEIQNEIETDNDTVRKAITEGMKRRLRDNSKPKFDYSKLPH